jgi:hypothetical protein
MMPRLGIEHRSVGVELELYIDICLCWNSYFFNPITVKETETEQKKRRKKRKKCEAKQMQ